ncbi:AzlD domain-containing protein [Mumia zhuanghuii]|uniref:AzlD domain-containing protein n=1 Tax=Mumia zhuanghuii TaxID=2585211 RepID=A0A5C4MJL5_9ACTN|nr:AzlD domain-containing protein [Mumia zhuanghuii]TNC45896.1 AzlD domain-containing protein [Mumia zhuanghuii]
MSVASFAVAVAVLAGGTYALRWGGVSAGARVSLTDETALLVERAVAVLLVAVVLTGTLDEGVETSDHTRAVGVIAGVIAALARAPLVVVVLVAVLATALLRAW